MTEVLVPDTPPKLVATNTSNTTSSPGMDEFNIGHTPGGSKRALEPVNMVAPSPTTITATTTTTTATTSTTDATTTSQKPKKQKANKFIPNLGGMKQTSDENGNKDVLAAPKPRPSVRQPSPKPVALIEVPIVRVARTPLDVQAKPFQKDAAQSSTARTRDEGGARKSRDCSDTPPTAKSNNPSLTRHMRDTAVAAKNIDALFAKGGLEAAESKKLQQPKLPPTAPAKTIRGGSVIKNDYDDDDDLLNFDTTEMLSNFKPSEEVKRKEKKEEGLPPRAPTSQPTKAPPAKVPQPILAAQPTKPLQPAKAGGTIISIPKEKEDNTPVLTPWIKPTATTTKTEIKKTEIKRSTNTSTQQTSSPSPPVYPVSAKKSEVRRNPSISIDDQEPRTKKTKLQPASSNLSATSNDFDSTSRAKQATVGTPVPPKKQQQQQQQQSAKVSKSTREVSNIPIDAPDRIDHLIRKVAHSMDDDGLPDSNDLIFTGAPSTQSKARKLGNKRMREDYFPKPTSKDVSLVVLNPEFLDDHETDDGKFKWYGLNVMRGEFVFATWEANVASPASNSNQPPNDTVKKPRRLFSPCQVQNYCPKTQLFQLISPPDQSQPPPLPRSSFYTRLEPQFLTCKLHPEAISQYYDHHHHHHDDNTHLLSSSSLPSNNLDHQQQIPPHLHKEITTLLPILQEIASRTRPSAFMTALSRGDMKTVQSLCLEKTRSSVSVLPASLKDFVNRSFGSVRLEVEEWEEKVLEDFLKREVMFDDNEGVVGEGDWIMGGISDAGVGGKSDAMSVDAFVLDGYDTVKADTSGHVIGEAELQEIEDHAFKKQEERNGQDLMNCLKRDRIIGWVLVPEALKRLAVMRHKAVEEKMAQAAESEGGVEGWLMRLQEKRRPGTLEDFGDGIQSKAKVDWVRRLLTLRESLSLGKKVRDDKD
ncbi:UNVERIFIED_CONTAM: hypothetical protein HDU68_005666 [Siphonaria sp. JEL0065]|nr:hypothetical protein HDU68_005666 [Siphonaria sp. JEL0065]